MGLTLADRRRHERFLIEEARARRTGGYIDGPVQPTEAIPRLLGDQLIDAGRAVVAAYHSRNPRYLNRCVRRLARLVGGEP